MARIGTFQGPTGPYERALSSIHPPDNNLGSVSSSPSSTTGGGSTTGGTTGTGDPATNPPTPPPAPRYDYTQAIRQLQTYIGNLERVVNPTTFQKTELQTYIARLADYLNRQSLGG